VRQGYEPLGGEEGEGGCGKGIPRERVGAAERVGQLCLWIYIMSGLRNSFCIIPIILDFHTSGKLAGLPNDPKSVKKATDVAMVPI